MACDQLGSLSPPMLRCKRDRLSGVETLQKKRSEPLFRSMLLVLSDESADILAWGTEPIGVDLALNKVL